MIRTSRIVRCRASDEQRILIRTAKEMDRVWATSLPFGLKTDRCWDYLLQAGRDLDRLRRHSEVIMRLEPKVGAR